MDADANETRRFEWMGEQAASIEDESADGAVEDERRVEEEDCFELNDNYFNRAGKK